MKGLLRRFLLRFHIQARPAFSTSAPHVFHQHQPWPCSPLTTQGLERLPPREGDIRPHTETPRIPQQTTGTSGRWAAALPGPPVLRSEWLAGWAEPQRGAVASAGAPGRAGLLASCWKDRSHACECANTWDGETAGAGPHTVADGQTCTFWGKAHQSCWLYPPLTL